MRFVKDGRPKTGLDAKLVIMGFEDRESVAKRSGSESAGGAGVGTLEEPSELLGTVNPCVVSIRRRVGFVGDSTQINYKFRLDVNKL